MIETRRATVNDIEMLEALDREVVAYHHALDPAFWLPPEKYAPDYFKNFWVKQIKSKDSLPLVLLYDDEIVGFFLAQVNTEELWATPYKISGYIDRVYIRKQFRGKGLTRAALAEAERWFKEHNVVLTELRVEARNELGKAVWEKLGFKPYVIQMKKEI